MGGVCATNIAKEFSFSRYRLRSWNPVHCLCVHSTTLKINQIFKPNTSPFKLRSSYWDKLTYAEKSTSESTFPDSEGLALSQVSQESLLILKQLFEKPHSQEQKDKKRRGEETQTGEEREKQGKAEQREEKGEKPCLREAKASWKDFCNKFIKLINYI